MVGPKPGPKGQGPRKGNNPIVKVQRPPRNKSIVPKKPDPKKQATPKQGKAPGRNGRLERTARRLTNGVVRDEMRSLRSQNREVNRAADTARDRAATQYDREASGLGYIRDEVSGVVGSLNQQGQDAFNAQSLVQNAAATALQAQLGNIYDAGEGSATAEMARLGLTGAQGFLGEMAQGEAYAKSAGAMDSTNNQANLGMQQQAAGTVGNFLSGMVQGQYMSDMGASLNARQDSMAAIDADQMDQQALVRDAIRDAQSGRKDTFFQLLTQLQQSGWGKGKPGGGAGGPKRPPAKPKDGGDVTVPKKSPDKPKPKPPPKKATPPPKKKPDKPKANRGGPLKANRGGPTNGRGR